MKLRDYEIPVMAHSNRIHLPILTSSRRVGRDLLLMRIMKWRYRSLILDLICSDVFTGSGGEWYHGGNREW